MSEPRTIVRIRSTFPPPRVCQSCYWRAMYESLRAQHTLLRRELFPAGRPRGRPPKPREEEHERELDFDID